MKHYKSLWRAAALLLFVFAMVFASCDSPMEPDSGALPGTETAPALQAGKATVNFTVKGDGGLARTVLPDLSEIDLGALSYRLTSGDTELAVFTGSGTTLTLDPGNWTFTINAKDTNDDIILTATVTAALTENQTNEVAFTLEPLKEGAGAVSVNFSYPPEAGITSVEISGVISGKPVNLSEADGAWLYEAANLEAGDYFAVFTFYRGTEAAAVVSETIQVRNKLTSKKTITLTAEDMKVVKPEVIAVGTTLADKLQWIKDHAANNTNYLVEVTADEVIAETTLEYSGKTGVVITLTGDDTVRTISVSTSSSIFIIESGVTLALGNNITLDGRSVTTDDAFVIVETGGTLILNDEAKIRGSTNWFRNTAGSGGGVIVRGGTFIMNGGEISENKAPSGGGVYVLGGTFTMNGGEIRFNTATDGDTGAGYGGGVYVNGGTFTMNGGKISGNNANAYINGVSGSGGGVYIAGNNTFTMNGGEISGNIAKNSGGGVYNQGTFTMNDGKISENKAATYNNSYDHSVYGSGGGVYNQGTFTMNSGEISGNSADDNGGGVYSPDRTFTMNGGEISGNNTVTASGGGVYLFNNSFTMSGGKISGNTAATDGGGVSGTITMSGGEISGNKATNGNGGGVFGAISKTGGVIYGNEVGEPDANTASRGHAVYTVGHLHRFRDTTLGAGDNNTSGDGWEVIPPGVITPLEGDWTPGNIVSGVNEWFAFTASAETQYIHAKGGTVYRFSFEVYDSAWQGVTSSTELFASATTYKSFSGLNAGETYYIRVSQSSGIGTYELGITENPLAPGTVSTALTDGWNSGNLAEGGEQCFTFTASAGTQYVHVKFGALTDLKVEVFGYGLNNDYGYNLALNGSTGGTTYRECLSFSPGQTYAIKVSSSSGSGDYGIAISKITLTPELVPSVLADGWNLRSIAGGGEEWFAFTANADPQYIHAKVAALTTYLYAQVYDSAFQPVGNRFELAVGYGREKQSLSGLSAGETYYFKVWPYWSDGSGTYEIAVNASETPPASP